MNKKTYGKPFMKNGIKYVHTMIWYKRPLFKIASSIQWFLWKFGVNWHIKSFGGQCTPDFSCCKNRLLTERMEGK